MGYMRHHALVVSGSHGNHVDDMHAYAVELIAQYDELPASLITPLQGEGSVNGYRSFAVLPDGSKEWWPTSDQGDEFRAELVRAIRALRYDDGSCPLGWCEVQFCDDEGDDRMTGSSMLDFIQAERS